MEVASLKRYTRRPYRFLHAFFLLVAVATSAFTGLPPASWVAAQEPIPSAIEIFKANLAAETPILNPFQVRAQFEMDGNQMADVTFGWSGGATASFRAKLPFMPGFGEIAGAIRPSGFALIKFGPTTQIVAPLVPYSQILELLPRVFNRELLAEFITSQEPAVRLVGEIEIKGRRAYVLEWQPTLGTLLDTFKSIFVKVTSDEAFRAFLTESGVPLDEIAAGLDDEAWQQALAKAVAETDGFVTVYRHYVDAIDYVTLGYESYTPDSPEFDEMLELLAPQVELEDITIGTDDHIQQLVWRIRIEMSPKEFADLAAVLEETAADGQEVENFSSGKDDEKTEDVAEDQDQVTGEGTNGAVQEPADDQAQDSQDSKEQAIANGKAAEEQPIADGEAIVFSLDMKVVLSRVDQSFLPTEVSGLVKVDPAAFMGAVSSFEGTGELPVPLGLEDGFEDSLTPSSEEALEPEEHTFRLTLQWDTTKGADPVLVENTQLKSAERSWQQALEAIEAEDWEAAVAPLARLTRQMPTFVYAHFYLSNAYIETGEIWAAIGELEQVIMLQPNDWIALNNLAYLYVDQDIDPERGLELALAAYDLLPDSAPAFVTDTLGWAYYKNGDLEAASWYLEDALVLLADENEATMYEPGEYAVHAAELHYHLAAVYATREMYDQAKEHVEAALEHNPDLEAARELLAEINEALAEATAESEPSA